MSIASIRHTLLLPERELVINKNFVFHENPALLASITEQDGVIKLWLFQQVPELPIVEIPDEPDEMRVTNRTDIHRRLYGLCVTLCASNQLEANDLYQETWLRVCGKLHQYNPEQSFEGWLTRVCVNLYRDMLRRERFSLNRFVTGGDKDALLEYSPAPERDDYSDLHAVIDRLPEKLRTTVILHYFQDKDIDATATALGIPPGTVKSRLSTARKRLKELLSYEPNI